MRNSNTSALVACAVALALLATACERPPVEAEQIHYRGVAMETVRNPRIEERKVAANQVPDPLPPAPADTPPATEFYKNVQVLGDTTSGEFTRLMGAITLWVSAKQGCNYCHVAGQDLSLDNVYTKTVARRMIQMTRAINSEWSDHVGETGVTCYTCHRGQPVPANYWFEDPGPMQAAGFAASTEGQNRPGTDIGLASLPADPFTAFLLKDQQIRVQSGTALPMGSERNIKETEWTYGFMIHLSESLGVNCTYCHNSRSFMPWEASTPQRVTAWHGIKMVRQLNNEYMEPLVDVFPANRKGPLGDVYKINCATCHQGVNKPLYGVSMVKDYPKLAR